MLELFDKSKRVRVYMWALLIMAFLFGMVWVLPNFINAVRWW